MYFIWRLTDVLTMTTLHYPLTFNSVKLKVLNRFTEVPRDNFKFGGNSNYIALCLADNLTMTNFFTLPPNFLRWAKMLTLNMFSNVPRGKLKKVMNFVL